MAIIKKNRNFSKIMDEVEVMTIPVVFIKKLTVFLENDKKIYFNNDDLQGLDSMETLLYNVSTTDQIIDVNVEIDLPRIESTIEQQVKLLLDKEKDD